MFVLPADLPPEQPVNYTLVEQCVNRAARHFQIHPYVIKAIIKVEGGKRGTMSRNSNKTYDMGLMQINTIHLPDIQKQYPNLQWQRIAFSECTNIAIGTWILSQRIAEAKSLWDGVGHYHSKTPKYKQIYLGKIEQAYREVIRNRGSIR
ncbi:lytic transglycosylase domain-containing protein [Vibrio breoganii]